MSLFKEKSSKIHNYELAFWGRIVNPLVTFIMLLLSAPFVIGLKRGVSVGGRMMIGVVIGMALYYRQNSRPPRLDLWLEPSINGIYSQFGRLALALYAVKRVQNSSFLDCWQQQ